MSGRFRGPIIYDSLDHVNPTGHQQPQLPRKEWRHTAVVAVTILTFSCMFIIVVYFLINILSSYYNNSFASFLIWLIYCAPVVAIILILYHGHMWLRIITKQAAMINILEKQTSVEDIRLLQKLLIPNYFDVAKTRATQSQFAGVQTLTYDASRTNSTMPLEQPVLPSEAELIEMLPEGNEPILLELKRRGIINRSNNSIFLGFKKE